MVRLTRYGLIFAEKPFSGSVIKVCSVLQSEIYTRLQKVIKIKILENILFSYKFFFFRWKYRMIVKVMLVL